MKDKSIDIVYLFENGKIGLQESSLKEVIKGVKASQAARHNAWIEDDNMYHYNDSPFNITSIKFNSGYTEVEYLEFEEKGRV